MKHLIFNWIIRKYWGEKLAALVMKFVLNQQQSKADFIMDVKRKDEIYYIGIYDLSIYCLHDKRDNSKPIFKFRYSIAFGVKNIYIQAGFFVNIFFKHHPFFQRC